MDFDFVEPPKDENNNNEINSSQPSQQKNDGFFNMDFQSNPSQSQPQTTLDDMLNMNFQPMSQSNDTNLNSNINTNMNLNNLNTKVDEEELKRNEAREKEAQERREKINQKMQKEQELRNEIIKKANEYMVQFEAQRQETIAKRRKALEEKNNNINQNKEGGNNADSWGRVNSNIDLKDSEYKGSQDVQRMREAMMNRTKDSNSEPLEKFFG